MACLVALIIAATVLTVPTGNKLVANAARTSPADAFWRAALPGAPMPEAIRELIHARADKASVLKDDVKPRDDGDIDPPPMSFNYDDYRAASRRNENAAPSAEVLLKHASSAQNAATGGDGIAAATSPTVFLILAGGRGDDAAVVCDTDTSRLDPKHAALLRLLGVKPGGAAVCHAVPDAQVLTAGNDEIPVSP